WTLIQHGGGQFYESNPVAAWCLRCGGWAGLAGFKAASVLLAATLAVAVARSRPRAAGRLVGLGGAAVGGGGPYRLYLGLAGSVSLDELRGAEELAVRVEAKRARAWDYGQLQSRVVGKLIRGRCGLAEAAAELEPAARTLNQSVREGLAKRYGG